MKEFWKGIEDKLTERALGGYLANEIIYEEYGREEFCKFILWWALHRRMSNYLYRAAIYNHNSDEPKEVFRKAVFVVEIDMFCIYRASKRKDTYVDTLKKLGIYEE